MEALRKMEERHQKVNEVIEAAQARHPDVPHYGKLIRIGLQMTTMTKLLALELREDSLKGLLIKHTITHVFADIMGMAREMCGGSVDEEMLLNDIKLVEKVMEDARA